MCKTGGSHQESPVASLVCPWTKNLLPMGIHQTNLGHWQSSCLKKCNKLNLHLTQTTPYTVPKVEIKISIKTFPPGR